METIPTFDQVATAIGGGVTTVLGYWIYLTMSGRLRMEKEVDAALKSKDEEIAYLKTKLDGAEIYIKELVNDMNEQNQAIRHEVFPSITSILQHILSEKGGKNVH